MAVVVSGVYPRFHRGDASPPGFSAESVFFLAPGLLSLFHGGIGREVGGSSDFTDFTGCFPAEIPFLLMLALRIISVYAAKYVVFLI